MDACTQPGCSSCACVARDGVGEIVFSGVAGAVKKRKASKWVHASGMDSTTALSSACETLSGNS